MSRQPEVPDTARAKTGGAAAGSACRSCCAALAANVRTCPRCGRLVSAQPPCDLDPRLRNRSAAPRKPAARPVVAGTDAASGKPPILPYASPPAYVPPPKPRHSAGDDWRVWGFVIVVVLKVLLALIHAVS